MGISMKEYVIQRDEEKKIRADIEKKGDAETTRIKRYLAMPDLSRTPLSPVHELVKKVISIPTFKNFDLINVPEVVPVDIAFDLFEIGPEHPARSRSDTYYANDNNILRPHTTVMWYYYLTLPEVKEKLAKGEDIGVFSFGKVYRKDEIDRTHMNVFHQIDGLYLSPKSKKQIGLQDLQDVEVEVVKSMFGEAIKYRFHEETFPYTDPSTEIEMLVGEKWVEILGSGVVKGSVLEKLGVDPKIYNGWAFGFGLERFAIMSMELPDIRLLWSKDPRVVKQLKLGQTYKEVSKFPAVVRDISFVIANDFVPNNYFDLIRETVGDDIVEEVKLIDRFENAEKFGTDKVSYAYRIVYRSTERTLTNEEVDVLHKKLEQATATLYAAQIR
ncbi:MAG: hypothetical protein A3J10_01325 [Candidatus Sungbacteria bacterium RIFCSPLOWO2_02_FULL_54_10]|nr:MAG: hypothetical protein A3J10_01325 [Candidatus Sungbacteria bacterium RIFCSPLOWO2_02_FULL_54_10]